MQAITITNLQDGQNKKHSKNAKRTAKHSKIRKKGLKRTLFEFNKIIFGQITIARLKSKAQMPRSVVGNSNRGLSKMELSQKGWWSEKGGGKTTVGYTFIVGGATLRWQMARVRRYRLETCPRTSKTE
jgi:hypothetical protein